MNMQCNLINSSNIIRFRSIYHFGSSPEHLYHAALMIDQMLSVLIWLENFIWLEENEFLKMRKQNSSEIVQILRYRIRDNKVRHDTVQLHQAQIMDDTQYIQNKGFYLGYLKKDSKFSKLVHLLESYLLQGTIDILT